MATSQFKNKIKLAVDFIKKRINYCMQVGDEYHPASWIVQWLPGAHFSEK
jgi:hypothetical protein